MVPKDRRKCEFVSSECDYSLNAKANLFRLQTVMSRFSSKLRRLSTDDPIIKEAGVAGYAQEVLVPELAVQLVKEDMGVSDEAARQILRDSIDLGEKLNPALNDYVPLPDEARE